MTIEVPRVSVFVLPVDCVVLPQFQLQVSQVQHLADHKHNDIQVDHAKDSMCIQFVVHTAVYVLSTVCPGCGLQVILL